MSTPPRNALQDAEAARLHDTLRDVVPGACLDALIADWLQCQARSEHCSVRTFVGRMVERFQLDSRVADQLTVKLFGAVFRPRPARRQPVASDDKAERPTGGARPAAPSRPRRKSRDAMDPGGPVFRGLMHEIDRLARSRVGPQWDLLCAELAREWDHLPSLLPGARRLLRDGTDPADFAQGVAEESERQAMVHGYYLALCKAHGPAEADRLLSDAVHAIEQDPLAAGYSPRRLL